MDILPGTTDVAAPSRPQITAGSSNAGAGMDTILPGTPDDYDHLIAEVIQ
jgi:hypothetical protein